MELNHLHTPTDLPISPRPRASRRGFLRRYRKRLAVLFIAAFAGTSSYAQIADNDFDDGTTQGWGPRGGVSVTASTDAARSGSYSLLTTNRTANWQGPSLNLTNELLPDETYDISGWVQLAAGESPTDLKFTMQRNHSGGTAYNQVAAAAVVTDSGWVELSGTYSYTGNDTTALTLYLESSNPTVAYHLDDVLIEGQEAPSFSCPEPLDQSGLFTEFESGSSEGWYNRGGSVAVQAVTDDAFSGAYSLEVTGRTATWQGASINTLCKLHKGERYIISMWVKLLPGQDPSDLRVTFERNWQGTTSYHGVIGNTQVTSDEWVNLSTELTWGYDAEQLQLYVESPNAEAAFYIDEFLLMHQPPVPIQKDIPSLKDVLADYFPLGTAIEPAETVGQHAELLLKHFDIITAGNAMKWSSLQPTEGNFNWGPADTIADFARDNGLLMRGHTLVWHSQVPDWVFEDAGGNPLTPGNAADRQLVIDRMRTHINAVMTRYSDVIYAWDVVNEVIDPNYADGYRRSPWFNLVGPEFVDLAFQFASELNTGAQLYINDYSTTTQPAKREALRLVVQGLLDRNVPVDGVGHQMHINLALPADVDAATTETLELFAGMGLANQITELDISVYRNSTDTYEPTEEDLVELGYRYRDLFDSLRRNRDIIDTVTLWGLADDNTWLKTFPITRNDQPLPFDEDLQAKWAYWGIVDPTMLPLSPKAMRTTEGYVKVNAAQEWVWDTIAPTLLESEGAAGSWASFKTLWKSETLFVLVEVDDQFRNGDAVELFVEGVPYRFDRIGRQTIGGVDAMLVPNRGGYQLEASIPTGLEMAVGDQIGFDIRVSDVRTGNQASWSDIRHGQDVDDRYAGTLTLMGQKKASYALPGKVAIDGVMDRRWRLARSVNIENFVLGSSGATATAKLLTDGDYLYLFVEVSDPVLSKASGNPWEQDSIEIFIDENNGQTEQYESDDAQYRINFENEQSYGGAASSSKIQSATRVVNGGYVVEARIKLTDTGEYIGFDIQVNDDGAGDGVRSSVATWNDVSGEAYRDPSQFGVVKLGSSRRASSRR